MEEKYNGQFTGAEIDEAVGKVLDGGFATPEQVSAAIQSAVLDSWEGSY